MRSRSWELWYALLAVVLITVAYVLIFRWMDVVPPARSLFGHTIGVVGFLLMLMTETLYSIRKHFNIAANWGRMEWWLKFHIFTGVVGPYMVLLHSSWTFFGLAGVTTLLMIIIVFSGFIGRYIYTIAPRTAAGVELTGKDLEYYLEVEDKRLQGFIADHPDVYNALPRDLVEMPQIINSARYLLLTRILMEWGFNWRWFWMTHRLAGVQRLAELKRILDSNRALHYQVASLVLSRRLLAIWHTLHVPIGVALFITAFVHIGAALYFVTLAN
jgi:hypothetical protein